MNKCTSPEANTDGGQRSVTCSRSEMVNSLSLDEWTFYQHELRGWSWQCLGVAARHSEGHFAGIVEAIADASGNGFQPGISKIAGVSLCRRSHPR
jgi:hypothetical protein